MQLPTTKLILNIKIKSFHVYYINKFILTIKQKINYSFPFQINQVFLPIKIEKFTVLRSPHVDKKARDQFERRTYNRLLRIELIIQKDSFNLELFLDNTIRFLFKNNLGLNLIVNYYLKFENPLKIKC